MLQHLEPEAVKRCAHTLVTKIEAAPWVIVYIGNNHVDIPIICNRIENVGHQNPTADSSQPGVAWRYHPCLRNAQNSTTETKNYAHTLRPSPSMQ